MHGRCSCFQNANAREDALCKLCPRGPLNRERLHGAPVVVRLSADSDARSRHSVARRIGMAAPAPHLAEHNNEVYGEV